MWMLNDLWIVVILEGFWARPLDVSSSFSFIIISVDSFWYLIQRQLLKGQLQ